MSLNTETPIVVVVSEKAGAARPTIVRLVTQVLLSEGYNPKVLSDAPDDSATKTFNSGIKSMFDIHPNRQSIDE